MIGKETTAAAIVEYARSAFSFLATDGATVTEGRTPTDTTLVYLLGRCAFEVEIDWREGVAFVLVGVSVNGNAAPGYYAYRGRRVRMHLTEALGRLDPVDNARITTIRTVVRHHGANAMKQQIDAFADAMKTHLAELLQYLPEILPSQR